MKMASNDSKEASDLTHSECAKLEYKLMSKMEENVKDDEYGWKDIAKEYKARKYNRKANRRMSEGKCADALKMWEQSAKQGYHKALFNLGLCYEVGQGVEQNLNQAMVYYASAAEQNNKYALYNLGHLYELGINADGPNESEAIACYEKAAALGHSVSSTTLGVLQSEKDNMTEAVKWFKLAASGCDGKDDKDGIGVLFLGHTYFYGHGQEQNKSKARELYKSAVEIMSGSKESSAQFFLGMCHQFGWGIEENKSKAVEFYKNSEHPDSQSSLHSLMKELKEESEKPSTVVYENSDLNLGNLELKRKDPAIFRAALTQKEQGKRKTVEKKGESEQFSGTEERLEGDDWITFSAEEPDVERKHVDEKGDHNNTFLKQSFMLQRQCSTMSSNSSSNVSSSEGSQELSLDT